MKDLFKYINNLSPIDEIATGDLMKVLKIKTLQKNDYLVRSNEVCKYLYFIDQGLTKTFFYKSEKQFIMRFFKEKEMFTILDSYLTQSPSNFMIMALEPTSVVCIPQDEMAGLCQKHHCVETFFRKLLSLASINMMVRISEMLEENATERYNHFLSDNNLLLQRISLGDLACYLGITQVSLSRIRAKK